MVAVSSQRDRSSNLGAGPNSEAQLGLLAVINRKTLQHEAAKTTAGASPNCVEDHEALQACAIVGKLADAPEAPQPHALVGASGWFLS